MDPQADDETTVTTSSSPRILHPRPHRPFELPHLSSASSSISDRTGTTDTATPPPRSSTSTLNLNASTLFGIFAQAGASSSDDHLQLPATPWGTGAETPARAGTGAGAREDRGADLGAALRRLGGQQQRSGTGRGPAPSSPAPVAPPTRSRHAARRTATSVGDEQCASPQLPSSSAALATLLTRAVLLFAFGLAYGTLIRHLHDQRGIAPVRVEAVGRASWGYLAGWGIAGVGLGTLVPVVDGWWKRRTRERVAVETSEEEEEEEEKVRWDDVVRSVGAFVGIAFAIRKTPWQSTLQVSLTLALANPALWYLLDRSKPGLVLSSLIGVAGTAVLLAINPDMVPVPASSPTAASPPSGAGFFGSAFNGSSVAGGGGGSGFDPGEVGPRRGGDDGGPGALLAGIISYETIGVATWIASVLFCSCVCFGNIGRRLALPEELRGGWKPR